MNYSPTVTVVIPAFNASTFLAETIQTVLNQKFSDWELLIIDDGSTDNTAEIAKSYSRQDDRVRLVYQSNKGVSVARNLGVQLAKGKFIAFLDADDRWLPDKLACHVDHFSCHPEIGVSFARVKFIHYDGNSTGLTVSCKLFDLQPEDFLYENPTATTSNVVVRQEVFQQCGGFDVGMNYTEDTDWLFRVMAKSQWHVEGIDLVLVEYRTRTEGLSSDLYKMEAGWDLMIRKALECWPELVEKHYSIAQAIYLKHLARRAVRLGLPSEVGVDFMNRALRANWQVVIKQPRRTVLTMLAVYGIYFISKLGFQLKLTGYTLNN